LPIGFQQRGTIPGIHNHNHNHERIEIMKVDFRKVLAALEKSNIEAIATSKNDSWNQIIARARAVHHLQAVELEVLS
jgi:hypothetical protein